MEIIKLLSYKEKFISRGMVLRLPALWPYEDFVDFMVVDFVETHGLIVSSGYKAGLILVKFPQESQLIDVRALSTEWVINNWSKWIYPECDVTDVYIIEQYIATAID